MKPNITIKSLRQNGHQVFVSHLRRVTPDPRIVRSKPKVVHINKGKFNELGTVTIPLVALATGGATELKVILKSGKEYLVTSKTSKKDSYSKRNGVNICLGRFQKVARQNGDNI